MKIRFDQEKCTGCFSCYVACIAAHHKPEEEDAKSYRRIRTVVDEKAGFQKKICPGCIHCGRCMESCPSGALFREETYGLILADKETCAGCRVCALDRVLKKGTCSGLRHDLSCPERSGWIHRKQTTHKNDRGNRVWKEIAGLHSGGRGKTGE